MKKIVLVGVTGNFGSGKSTVCKILEELGFSVIYSDIVAKVVMQKNPELRRKLINAFGEETYLPDGSLNSKWLAEKVFATTEEAEENLLLLNSIVHPYVLDETELIINKLINEGKDIIFFESALIYEANIQNLFDYIVLVYADKDKVVERLLAKGKYSREEIERRLNRQISLEEKRKVADFVVINNGTVEELERNVKFIVEMIQELQSMAKKSKDNT
ncbi:MAG: dephospho-CoA kinase [Ignavibacteria bacterium]|nr:dephospho-CoA kinase [Ignavibacteria bacterium]